MTSISVPLWIFACSTAIPIFCLLWLLGMLIKKIRKPETDILGNAALQYFDTHQAKPSQFHNDLLTLQIDAIFNGMNAIIETERIKIRSLLNGSGHTDLNAAGLDQSRCAIPEMEPRTASAAKENSPSFEQHIADYSASGQAPDDIANEMGMSQSEVELAMMMRSLREKPQDRKLVAVA